MALDFDSKKALLGFGLVALLIGVPKPSPALESASAPTLESQTDEKQLCVVNLNLIFDAIQEYRRQHQRLPAKLSDLIPEFMDDPKTLICPIDEKTWTLRDWRSQRVRETDFDPHSSYSYEFTTKEIPDLLWRGLPKHNRREWKERQIGQMPKLGYPGGLVPIVRCFSHHKSLNLCYDGSVYDSERDWEAKFAQGEALANLQLPGRLFADRTSPKILSRQDFPPRDPGTPSRLIDLTAYYNAQLSDGWQGFPGNDLSNLPRGLQQFNGVPFDIRGVIQLVGAEAAVVFPNQIDSIAIRQRFKRLNVLHAATFPPEESTNLASYVIHYANGQANEIPISYGQNIADWWFDPKDESKRPSVPKDAQVAWEGDNQAVKAYGKLLRIYQMSWDNPLPDIEVVSISLVSRMNLSAPFIIAVTVDL